MNVKEPMETQRVIKFSERKEMYGCTVEFRKLLEELLERGWLPCEINIQVIFFMGGCPHN